MDDFGERLRKLRVAQDLTQQQLGEKLGVVSSTIGKYEKVKDSYPSIEVLIKLSDFFSVSTDYLLKGVEPTGNVENNINGSLSNSPFIQANHGGVVYNGDSTISPEALELLRIYENLSGRSRLKLLNFAVELEGGKD